MTETEGRGVVRDGVGCEVCGSPGTELDGRVLCIECWLAIPEAERTP